MLGIFKRKSVAADAARFLVAGGINTLLSFLCYQLLLFVASPVVSYAVSWLAGLAIVLIFYPRAVFREPSPTAAKLAALALSYLGVFLSGLLALQGLAQLGVNPRIAIFFCIVVTTATNFFLARLLLKSR